MDYGFIDVFLVFVPSCVIYIIIYRYIYTHTYILLWSEVFINATDYLIFTEFLWESFSQVLPFCFFKLCLQEQRNTCQKKKKHTANESWLAEVISALRELWIPSSLNAHLIRGRRLGVHSQDAGVSKSAS